jgi:hypothetical protein
MVRTRGQTRGLQYHGCFHGSGWFPLWSPVILTAVALVVGLALIKNSYIFVAGSEKGFNAARKRYSIAPAS